MSAPDPLDSRADTPTAEPAPTLIAPVTMLGSPDAAVCAGDVCAMPTRD